MRKTLVGDRGHKARDGEGVTHFNGFLARWTIHAVMEEMMRVDLYALSMGRSKLLRPGLNESAYFRSAFITTGKK
jgi:hypothetical protein